MLNELFEWLKGVAVFVIICEMTLSFAPSHDFKKYIKPFAGLLIILRITVFLMGQGTEILKLDIEDIFENYQISLTEVVNQDFKLKNQKKMNELEEGKKTVQDIEIHIENISLENISLQE